MIEKLAFVAMKFNSDSWNDKPYNIIREVADEAGYKTLRSDEINTSGAVVDEVCRYLSEAELVIVDTTGDSQSVSYELGYCHGVERLPGSLLFFAKGQEMTFHLTTVTFVVAAIVMFVIFDSFLGDGLIFQSHSQMTTSVTPLPLM